MTAGFYSTDPNPGIALSSIEPSGSRVQSWIARAIQRPDFPFEREVQIRGAIDIVTGLEYHHTRFTSQLALLEDWTSSIASSQDDSSLPTPFTHAQAEILSTLQHEAVAYVNRIGQLHFFARSLQRSALLLKATTLLPFRHKYTAHRSIDEPRSESASELMSQAMAFGFGHTFIGGRLVFQILSDGSRQTLSIQEDHPSVVREAVAVFESICPLPNDA